MNLQRLLPGSAGLAARVPRCIAERAADAAGVLAWGLWRAGRGRLAVNLRSSGMPADAAATSGAFRTYARYYLSMLRLSRLDQPSAVGRLRWCGRDHLETSLGRGRGALVLTAHFGNWDLVGAAIASSGYEVSALAERLVHDRVFEFYAATRTRLGMHVVTANQPGRRLHATLARNGVVAVVADRRFGIRSEPVPWGSACLEVPAGAIRLALRSGAAIHGVFALCGEDGFEIRCGPDWSAIASGSIEARAHAIAHRYAASLRDLIREHPGQWCHFARLGARPADRPAVTGRAA